jgi:hypothetical protein
MRTPVVDDIGELAAGAEKLPLEEKSHYFLRSAAFYQLYDQKKDIFCVTKYKNLEKLKKEVPNLNILWDNNYYYLIHLHKDI